MPQPFSSARFPKDSPSFFYVRIDAQGYYTFANTYYQKHFAHLATTFTGAHFLSHLLADDAPICRQALDYCMHHPENVQAVTLRKPAADGTCHYVHWNFFAAHNNAGETACIGYDITPFSVVADEHKATLQKLDAVLNSTNESFYLLDKDMKVLSFSRGAKNASKRYYDVDMQEGFDFKQQLLPGTEQEFTSQFAEALQGNATFSENHLVFPTGKEVWFRLTVSPAHSHNGDVFGVALSFVNIDLLKQSERQLKDIARLQSHHVRRPLTNILTLAELMQHENDTVRMAEMLEHLQASAKELDQIVKTIVQKAALLE
jgi:PAS domain S-box-containing protein